MLVGRDAEVARICEPLGREDLRLVTLTGPGGVGKSRLGLRSATVSAEVFADGVAFVSLGALRDPLLVANEVAAALGVADAGDLAPLDRVRMHLREREMLLLLDGFEQLLAAARETDSGGLLSHAAIVSREYGIPDVVGTHDATALIPDGALVRVAGDTGEVEVMG